MEYLFIDVGNSYIKAAEKPDRRWELVYREKTGNEKRFRTWLDERSERRIVVCSVIEPVSRELQQRYSGKQLRIARPGDIPAELIRYETVQTLGMDRFFTCFGASGQAPGAVVVIDAGSACTIDYMSAAGIFFGGVIMPGLQAIRSSVTQNMPLLPQPDEFLPERWPGKSTIDCVRWGTTGAFLKAIEGFLHEFRSSFGQFTVYATGGTSELVVRHLGTQFEIEERPFLAFEGMQAFYGQYEAGSPA